MVASASRIICCRGCAATALMWGQDINMKPAHIRKWSRRVVSPIPAAAAALAPRACRRCAAGAQVRAPLPPGMHRPLAAVQHRLQPPTRLPLLQQGAGLAQLAAGSAFAERRSADMAGAAFRFGMAAHGSALTCFILCIMLCINTVNG